ncbi:hypothetical protein [Herbaspirillum sp. RV1423]|uniref:hypothetical protein n=1 Tax=Herbaspirillum sp. RV1423 TaxID=1443993 RepID=UPI0004BB98A5|nr:hypothetical protein [Herbaspirillum sp. RV1423]
MLEPPLKPGQVLDKNSEYAKKWPGRPALFKLKDNLILAIPPQYQQFWLQYDRWGRDRVMRPPTPISKLPKVGPIGFKMFFPDFNGYTPDNYLNEFDEDMVNVVQVGSAPMEYAEPGAAGSHVPNMFDRVSTGQYRSIDPEKYEDKFGLRCYEKLNVTSKDEIRREYCFGSRDVATGETIMLDVDVSPYPDWVKFPFIKTKYFSKKYGGMEIAWRAHAKHFKDWESIDEQIWKYIDAWNIAPTPNTVSEK